MSERTESGKRLAGRTIAVTGASKGIGLAIVELLASNGASVFGGARDVEGLQVSGATFAVLDVTSESSVSAFADAAISAGVDTLINNAGVGSFSSIDEISVADYRRVMDTNVLGVILACRYFLPQFKHRHTQGKSSQVVNITSDVSARTFANGGLYTASKHAQRALTQALACEGERFSLRVTEIRPGMTDTFFNGNVPGSADRSQDLRPEDIAEAVFYALAAPAHVRVDEVLVHPVAQDVAF